MIIARIFGGLGNQLFIYSTAKRLALYNDVPLRLDIQTGFENDPFQRKYCLDKFAIDDEPAGFREGVIPGRVGWYLRSAARRGNRWLPYRSRFYFSEPENRFDARLLTLQTKRRIILDGYWQDPRYFEDASDVLQRHLQFRIPHEPRNLAVAKRILSTNAIAVHARRLHGVHAGSTTPNPAIRSIPVEYYRQAIQYIQQRVPNPVFFCFSDYPQWFAENLGDDIEWVTVEGNGEERNYEDLWLLSCCKHHIIANSTFSWWGAWLASAPEKTVVAPEMSQWGQIMQLPKAWNAHVIQV